MIYLKLLGPWAVDNLKAVLCICISISLTCFLKSSLSCSPGARSVFFHTFAAPLRPELQCAAARAGRCGHARLLYMNWPVIIQMLLVAKAPHRRSFISEPLTADLCCGLAAWHYLRRGWRVWRLSAVLLDLLVAVTAVLLSVELSEGKVVPDKNTSKSLNICSNEVSNSLCWGFSFTKC